MQRVPVESRSIASVGCAPQERVLELETRQSSEVYRYFDVPTKEHVAFLGAKSKGTDLNQQCKLRIYRYVRIQSTPKQASPLSQQVSTYP